MLRAGTSRTSNNLSRRKSTSSVIRKQDHIDPETAREHATAAAIYAFTRAQERSGIDMGTRRGMSRIKATLEHPNQRRASLPEKPARFEDHGLRRQQSVRFAGPNAVKRRSTIGPRLSQDAGNCKGPSETLRPRALTNDTAVPAAYRPSSRSSSIGKSSLRGGNATRLATALAAYDEYYAGEDDLASTPSSYRRIRKSKSVTNEPRTSDVFFHSGTPDSKASASPPKLRYLKIRAPKSMSFLRGARDQTRPPNHQEPDAAVQGARDRFLHDLEKQRLREQPSFIFRSRARREEKPFRQSVRSNGANSYGSPIASTNQPALQYNDSRFRTKARKVSLTIRSKLKAFFHRGEEKEEVVIPDQQVQSHDSHGGQLSAEPLEKQAQPFADMALPDNATVSHVASRVPSLHTVPSYQQLKSRAGSVQSLRSERSTKSRVTSWTSTREDTSNSRFAAAERERERQRLSIIQEHGTHISSQSFHHRRGARNNSSSYPALHLPCSAANTSLKIVPPSPVPPPIDSARVYSALMKRLDENSPNAKLAQRLGSVESLNAPFRVPVRTSSITNLKLAGTEGLGPPYRVPPRRSSITDLRILGAADTPSTVRHVGKGKESDPVMVTEQRELLLGHALAGRYNSDDVFSPEAAARSVEVAQEDQNVASNDHVDRAGSLSVHSHYAQMSAQPEAEMHGASHHMGSQQDFHMHVGNQRKSVAVRERGSGFFGSAAYTMNRTTSPYRKALAACSYNPAVVTGDTPVKSKSPTNISADESPRSSDHLEVSSPPNGAAYSESVYSRTTSGRTPATSETFVVPQDDQDFPLTIKQPLTHVATVPGDAVILGRATYKPKKRARPLSNSAGSTEWKSWMNAQVSALERQGHVRENAQIDGDDIEIKPSKPSAAIQPVGILLRQQISKSMAERELPREQPPTTDSVPTIPDYNAPVERPSPIPIPPPLPPPMPQRSPLRTIQSKTSMQSVRTIGSQAPRIDDTPISAVKVSENHTRVVLHRKSTGSIRTSDTPTAKLVRKSDRRSGYTTSSSGAGTLVAVERQFGSSASRRNTASTSDKLFWSATSRLTTHSLKGDENSRDPAAADVDADAGLGDEYEVAGAGLLGPQVRGLDAQAIGSKRMVDLFLSSRRRKVAGSDETNAFM